MGCEGEDERIARWERWALEDAAKHRRRMRWWRHMREYVSMKRLFVNRLVAGEVHLRATSTGGKTWHEPGPDTDYRIVTDPVTDPVHPPWSSPSNWWPRYRWNRQG